MRARVAWHEGMHLAPQHFQQQQRSAEESMRVTLNALVPDAWGVMQLRIDPAALARGVVALQQLDAILPDGLAVSGPQADPLPAPLTLAEQWPAGVAAQQLHLVVTPHSTHLPMVRLDGTPADAFRTRFRAVRVERSDDMAGGDMRPVLLAEKQLALVLDSARDPRDVALPLARLVRDARGQVTIDPLTSPPALHLAGSALLRERLPRLLALLEARCDALQHARAHDTLANYGPLEIARVWLHHALRTGLAPLAHLARTPGTHPERLYVALLSLAGALSTFGARSDVDTLSAYRHEAPHDWYLPLEQHIRTHLDLVLPTGCLVVPLAQEDALLHRATLDDPRAFASTHWFLGVRSAGSELQRREQVPMLIKLAPARDLVALVQAAASGLALEVVPYPPAAIAPRHDTVYFRVLRSEPAWSDLVDAGELGAYVPAVFADAELELRILLV
jgi:type VI secretion system protein ImpJ